jgi:cytochrome P450 family 89 subfamily A
VTQREFLSFINKLNVFAILPRITRYIFRDRLRKAIEFRERQKSLFLPLIRARRDLKHKQGSSNGEERFVYSYVDSLLDIKLPEVEDGGRNLNEEEIVSLCSEFLDAGTDTTSTALQWIMANLVKNQDVQSKLAQEIESIVGEDRAGEVREEELQQMPYLKAVIMEGLRRHPPGHFVLPHTVTEEVQLGDYVIPKNAAVNFMVTEMNWDKNVWKDPLEFRPERFLPGGEGEAVDITGSREITMMSFGAGRRICPGLGLAMLHLEYFVANLVREFKWTTVNGEQVDLTEKPVFTVVMEKPLNAKIVPTRNPAAAAF